MIGKLLAATMSVMVAQHPAWAGEFIQYGTMHEAIGQKKMQGRVWLGDATKKPHLYAVGAEEDLLGEITILDGQIMLTRAEDRDAPRSISTELDSVKATLLIGAYVKDWDTQTSKEPISVEQLENLIEARKKKGQTEPVIFKVDGHFQDDTGDYYRFFSTPPRAPSFCSRAFNTRSKKICRVSPIICVVTIYPFSAS